MTFADKNAAVTITSHTENERINLSGTHRKA